MSDDKSSDIGLGPASVALLDARLTGDQKVENFTTTELATFFMGDCS